MALLLAPYNNAMRLGMGFNSFTQQLCINDAVQKTTGVPATEADLNSKPLTKNGQPNGVPQHFPSAETTSLGLQKTQAGTYVRTHSDGSQAEISQIVTWKSEFVDNISDIMNSMNISGSLAIKVDAIGGGAKAEGHYVNTETIKNSDLNFHIQVNVINQKLVADDVTEFMPIKKVTPPQFRDVYGDSYISGFIEGGVLNAIISVEMVNKKDINDIGGSLALSAKFLGGAVAVEGEAAGKVEKNRIENNNKTTISVSWSGGGDIVPDSVLKTGWTMDNLREVAMGFADKVAICPQRTSAIITKYSSLRSFYEKTVNGTPLDYENAGVYAAALLDDYMDYKLLWKQLQATSSRIISHNDVILNKRKPNSDMNSLRNEMKKDYDARLKEYQDKINHSSDAERSMTLYDSSASAVVVKKPEKPITQNKLNPYGDSLFAIEEARRDCRFEMIKIVREVDAVSEDPSVATDVDRQYQYLAPTLFKQLIPGEEIVDPKALRDENVKLKAVRKWLSNITKVEAKKIADLKIELEKTKSSFEKVQQERDELNRKLEELQRKYDEKSEHCDRAEKERDEAKRALEESQTRYQTKEEECHKAEYEKDELKHKLEESQTKYTDKDEQCHRLEQERAEATNKSLVILEENIAFRKTLDAAKETEDQLTKSVERMKGDLSRIARCWEEPAKESYCANEILEIRAIIYAGKRYTSEEVMRTFILLGSTGVPFWINDHLFRDDPWVGYHKSMVIVYRYTNETNVRILAGGQERRVRFERQSPSMTDTNNVVRHVEELLDKRGWGHVWRQHDGVLVGDPQWG